MRMLSPARAPKKSRAGVWVVLGVAVVLVAAAGVLLVPKLISARSKDSGADQHSSASAAACTDTFDLPNLLAADLTAALQKHDEAAFLALAGAGSAKTAMSTWWANVDAIGFTTGGVQALDSNDATPSDGPPRSISVLVGLHNAFDTTSSGVHDKQVPDAAATGYQLGLKVTGSGAGCRAKVTSWTSRSDAPWDIPSKLYVVKTKHTVVAGEQQMKSEVDRIAPYAEKAALWNFGFFAHNKRRDYISRRASSCSCRPPRRRSWAGSGRRRRRNRPAS